MIAWGKKERKPCDREFNCAVEVMRGAEAVDEYIAPRRNFRANTGRRTAGVPPRRTRAEVIMVIGTGSGIGREVATAWCATAPCRVRGHEPRRQATAKKSQAIRCGVGVLGSSNCSAIGSLAITDRASVRAMLDECLAYGEFDNICVTAGVLAAIPLATFRMTNGTSPSSTSRAVASSATSRQHLARAKASPT